MAKRDISLIGFPIDLGADRRGVDMGPSALRLADLDEKIANLGFNVTDLGDIPIRNIEVQDLVEPTARYLPEVTEMSAVLARHVKDALDSGAFPVVLGGDHSMSIGTLAGIGRHCHEHGKTFGVIWIDAHADMNTPTTTPSGNIHGMPLAIALGYGHADLLAIAGDQARVDPKNIAIIGLRSIDPGERGLIRDLNITTYTMFDIDRLGMYEITERVLNDFASRVDHLHVSFDADGVDPRWAPGVGTPVDGGLTFREAHLLMEMVSRVPSYASLEVAEVNPILDVRNQTAEFISDVIASSLGKHIL